MMGGRAKPKYTGSAGVVTYCSGEYDKLLDPAALLEISIFTNQLAR